MKTTIDLDERRLKSVMRLVGVRTRKAAIEYALRHTEMAARMNRLFDNALSPDAFEDAVDPSYDVTALREKEKAKYRVAH